MKWLTLPAALVALVFGSEANAQYYHVRYGRVQEGEVVEAPAPVNEAPAPIVEGAPEVAHDPAPVAAPMPTAAGGCCGNGHHHAATMVAPNGCSSGGGCGAGARGGYLGFSWATGCCAKQPSCCDGIWDGFCDSRTSWCNRNFNWGCDGCSGGCYDRCGMRSCGGGLSGGKCGSSCFAGCNPCGGCRPQGCGNNLMYRTRGFGFGSIWADNCSTCDGGYVTSGCASGNCHAPMGGCANGGCAHGAMNYSAPAPVPVGAPIPQVDSEARMRMQYRPMPVNQPQPYPTGKTASRGWPTYFYPQQNAGRGF